MPLFPQGFLAPGEIDPLNRRFATVPKPDVVVQGEGKGSVPNPCAWQAWELCPCGIHGGGSGVALLAGWLPVQPDLSPGKVGIRRGASPSAPPCVAPGKYHLLQPPLQRG